MEKTAPAKTAEKPAAKEEFKIIAPHNKKSRPVKEKDFERVKEAYYPLRALMAGLEEKKIFSSVYAVAHSQVTKKDPLRFFVINSTSQSLASESWELPDDLIINPEIINHVRHTSEKKEGCITFVGYPDATVERWHKIVVRFQTLDHEGGKLISHEKACSGKLAELFQHEIDHFDAKYIWQGLI